jgi:hypothetical protein
MNFDIFNLFPYDNLINRLIPLKIKEHYGPHLLPKSNSKEKQDINKEIKDNLVNKIYDILDKIKSIGVSHFEILDTINNGVVCFYLPRQKKINMYTPECIYKHYKYVDTINSKLESSSFSFSGLYRKTQGFFSNMFSGGDHIANLKKYIKDTVNTMTFLKYFTNDHTSISYDINEKAYELLEKYLKRRNPDFLEKEVIDSEFSNCIVACIYLSSPYYHKILSTHSYKEKINELFHKRFTYNGKNIKPYIDDVWTTFGGKLPIEVPQL